MKYLHIGYNICGIPSAIARVQKTHDIDSKVLGFVPEIGHPADEEVITWNSFLMTYTILTKFLDYDVFHFHCITCTKSGIDILLWKLLGKKVVIHYHGSDIRNKKQKFFHKFANAWFVSTPDLLTFIPDAEWMPSPIFLEDYPEKIINNRSAMQIIMHAPSNTEVKGTRFLEDAMHYIQNHVGCSKLQLITGMPYQEAIQEYRNATVMVDQLLIGWYGMVALEAMAMKIPVLCYITPGLKLYLPRETALKITDINTIGVDLVELLQNKERLEKLSQNGYKYVKYVHSPEKAYIMIMRKIVYDLPSR